MTRKEALEYINNMYMYEDTKNALETLIPEFGKTCSDKVIDHEDKYKEALLEARAVLEPCLKYSKGKVREALDSIDKELKSFESEDERIRKLLVWQVYRNIEDETNDLAQSVYDGIKGHDPDLEESIEDWKKCLAYLEKQKEPENTSASTMAPSCWEVEQKEQKPVEPSDNELQRYQDELYDFKVFAAKQAKEHHISFVHDFEWNNFCAELLSYFNEKQKQQKLADLSEMMVHKEPYIAPVPTPMVADEQKPTSISCGHENDAEWGQEDKEKIVTISEIIEHCTTIPYSGGTLTLNKEYKKELLCFIRTLRPSWKPSEDELAKKHLEGYIKGRNDALREMSDFMESHFDTKKAKEGEDLTDLYYKEYVRNPQPIPSGCGCDGTHCTNPQMDCINCPRKTTGGSFSTSSASGTSTAKAEG